MTEPEEVVHAELVDDEQLDKRIARLVGQGAASQIIKMIENDLNERCRDSDCIRRRKHSRLAMHLWRHEPSPPLTRTMFGWRCFNCGRLSWRRNHRTGRRVT